METPVVVFTTTTLLIGLLALVGNTVATNWAVSVIDTFVALVIFTHRFVWCARRGFGLGDMWTINTGVVGTVTLERGCAAVFLHTVVAVICTNCGVVGTLNTLVLVAVWLGLSVFSDTSFVIFVHGVGTTLLALAVEAVVFSERIFTECREASAWTLYTDVVGITVSTVGVFTLADGRTAVGLGTLYTAVFAAVGHSGVEVSTSRAGLWRFAGVVALSATEVDTSFSTTFGVTCFELAVTLDTLVIQAVCEATAELLARAILGVGFVLTLNTFVSCTIWLGRWIFWILWVALRCARGKSGGVSIATFATLVLCTILFVRCFCLTSRAVDTNGIVVRTGCVGTLVVGTELPFGTVRINCTIPRLAGLFVTNFVHATDGTNARFGGRVVRTPVGGLALCLAVVHDTTFACFTAAECGVSSTRAIAGFDAISITSGGSWGTCTATTTSVQADTTAGAGLDGVPLSATAVTDLFLVTVATFGSGCTHTLRAIIFGAIAVVSTGAGFTR